ncbi:MAG TPA: hypothetical protein VMJ65_06160 [Solirubrobacteraceae bacterium]|nr:hypothetical protein [Solirubrobacteraceae bacterium]
MAVSDYHDGFNALGLVTPPIPPVPSHVSFDVRWAGNGTRQTIRDDSLQFRGEYVPGPTTISFTAFNDHRGVIYRSDPRGQYNPSTADNGSGPPAVGFERNGVFFR